MKNQLRDMNIGKNLRTLRKANGYTQEIIVDKIKKFKITITRSMYSLYEIGKLNIPISVLVALHIIYNCSYDEFFKGLSLEMEI